jgi:hypothetical protein
MQTGCVCPWMPSEQCAQMKTHSRIRMQRRLLLQLSTINFRFLFCRVQIFHVAPRVLRELRDKHTRLELKINEGNILRVSFRRLFVINILSQALKREGRTFCDL